MALVSSSCMSSQSSYNASRADLCGAGRNRTRGPHLDPPDQKQCATTTPRTLSTPLGLTIFSHPHIPTHTHTHTISTHASLPFSSTYTNSPSLVETSYSSLSLYLSPSSSLSHLSCFPFLPSHPPLYPRLSRIRTHTLSRPSKIRQPHIHACYISLSCAPNDLKKVSVHFYSTYKICFELKLHKVWPKIYFRKSASIQYNKLIWSMKVNGMVHPMIFI